MKSPLLQESQKLLQAYADEKIYVGSNVFFLFAAVALTVAAITQFIFNK